MSFLPLLFPATLILPLLLSSLRRAATVGMEDKFSSAFPVRPITTPPSARTKRSGTTDMPGTWVEREVRSASWRDLQKDMTPLVEEGVDDSPTRWRVPPFPSSMTPTVAASTEHRVERAKATPSDRIDLTMVASFVRRD